MDKQIENQKNSDFIGGGGVEFYKKKIIEMVKLIESEKFPRQIHTILKKHIEKRGC